MTEDSFRLSPTHSGWVEIALGYPVMLTGDIWEMSPDTRSRGCVRASYTQMLEASWILFRCFSIILLVLALELTRAHSAHSTVVPFTHPSALKALSGTVTITVWVYIPKKKRTKLQPKAHEGKLLGYEPPLGSHSYRILVDGQIITSCDVFFQKPSDLELDKVESESETPGEEGPVGTKPSQAQSGDGMPLQGEFLLEATKENPSLPSLGGVDPSPTTGAPDLPLQVCSPRPVRESANDLPLSPSDDESHDSVLQCGPSVVTRCHYDRSRGIVTKAAV